MGPIRSMITRWVLVVTVSITVASLWLVSQQDLAVEPERGHRELFTELTRVDLTQATADERSRLMRRVDRAFRLGADWQEPMLELDEPAWTRFRENLFGLLKVWLVDRANTYHSRGQGDGRRRTRRQERYVDEQVDTVMAWAAAAPQPSAEASRRLQSHFAPIELFVRVQQWTNEAEGDARVRLEAFTGALVKRAAERQRERLSGPGT